MGTWNYCRYYHRSTWVPAFYDAWEITVSLPFRKITCSLFDYLRYLEKIPFTAVLRADLGVTTCSFTCHLPAVTCHLQIVLISLFYHFDTCLGGTIILIMHFVLCRYKSFLQFHIHF